MPAYVVHGEGNARGSRGERRLRISSLFCRRRTSKREREETRERERKRLLSLDGNIRPRPAASLAVLIPSILALTPLNISPQHTKHRRARRSGVPDACRQVFSPSFCFFPFRLDRAIEEREETLARFSPPRRALFALLARRGVSDEAREGSRGRMARPWRRRGGKDGEGKISSLFSTSSPGRVFFDFFRSTSTH